MIIFYDTRDGRIFSAIDGRIHDQNTMSNMVSDTSVPPEFVGKKIIGIEETDEVENYTMEVEELKEVSDGLFKKIKKKINQQRKKLVEHNMDKFELLQHFEDDSFFTPSTHAKINIVSGDIEEMELTPRPVFPKNLSARKNEFLTKVKKHKESKVGQ